MFSGHFPFARAATSKRAFVRAIETLKSRECAVAAFAHWRDFTVEPILLIRQSSPRRFHSLVTLIGRIVRRTLGKVRAVLGIVAKDFGLFHRVTPSLRTARKRRAHDCNEEQMKNL